MHFATRALIAAGGRGHQGGRLRHGPGPPAMAAGAAQWRRAGGRDQRARATGRRPGPEGLHHGPGDEARRRRSANRITAPGVVVALLPAGAINQHWTKNLIASADSRKLYVTVGVAIDCQAALRVADDVGQVIWRVSATL